MKATSFKVNSGVKEDRWVWMMALSFCFHLTILSTTLFIPQTAIPFPSIEERIYHVELVGTPSGVRSGAIESPSGVGSGAKARGVAKRKTSHIFNAKTRRIAIKKKKTALIVAKRVSPIAPERNNFYSPSELIDSAISKIERRVKEEKPIQPEKILDKFKGDTEDLFKGKEGRISGISKGEKGGMSGTSSYTGPTIQLYQMEIESTVKNNWSYPVALLNLKRGKKIPEAVIIVTVRSDGKILKARFKRRSKNILFDDSVLKAIERSDPLPGFPPGYWKSYDEIEINFSLKDLVQY